MIVANGSATMEVDLDRLSGIAARSRMTKLSFTVVPNSFFTILVLNNELRGPLPSAMGLGGAERGSRRRRLGGTVAGEQAAIYRRLHATTGFPIGIRWVGQQHVC